MKTIVPDTYPLFHCIADKCRHTCCAGWEIDIDPDTLDKYASLSSPFGDRIRNSIDYSGETAHFRLSADERCPFLNAAGLCDLIVFSGEHLLCDICRDHPRYRFSFSCATETGLGLCCEEAVSIALGSKEKFSLISLEDDGADEAPDIFEEDFFTYRSNLFSLVQNRALPIHERIARIEKEHGAYLQNDDSLLALFLSLEHLDDAWPAHLSSLRCILKTEDCRIQESLEIPMEQLICHLIFRHLSPAVDDDLFPERIGLCVILWRLIASFITETERKNGACTFSALTEFVRLMSSEIEYSDQNTDKLLEALS